MSKNWVFLNENYILEKNIIFVLNYFQGSCSRIPPSFIFFHFWCFICIIWDEKKCDYVRFFFHFVQFFFDIFVDFIFIFVHFFWTEVDLFLDTTKRPKRTLQSAREQTRTCSGAPHWRASSGGGCTKLICSPPRVNLLMTSGNLFFRAPESLSFGPNRLAQHRVSDQFSVTCIRTAKNIPFRSGQ